MWQFAGNITFCHVCWQPARLGAGGDGQSGWIVVMCIVINKLVHLTSCCAGIHVGALVPRTHEHTATPSSSWLWDKPLHLRQQHQGILGCQHSQHHDTSALWMKYHIVNWVTSVFIASLSKCNVWYFLVCLLLFRSCYCNINLLYGVETVGGRDYFAVWNIWQSFPMTIRKTFACSLIALLVRCVPWILGHWRHSDHCAVTYISITTATDPW